MPSARRNTKQPQQYPTWLPAFLTMIGALVGVVVVAFGYPGVALTWLVMTIAAWTAMPAQFTGKKDASGFPTAAHAGETAAMQRYRFWADLKWHLIFPTSTLLPGWPPYAAWFYGLWASAVMWCLPYAEHGPAVLNDIFRFTDAVLAFIIVSQTAAARRRTVTPGDVSPGVRVNAIKHLKGANRKTLLIGGFVTLAATALGAYFAGTAIPAPPLPVGSAAAWYVLGAIGGFGAGAAWWWIKASLTPWRELVAARAEWAPRWTMLKHDPAPFLVSREKVGNATVDTFDAPGSMGAVAYWPLAAKVTPTMGAGQRLAVMSSPNTDSQGQPQPGTKHPLRFRIVCWPADATPNVMDPATDPDEVALFIEAAMVWACDASGYARPILDETFPIALTSAPEAPAPTGDEVDEDGNPIEAEAPQASPTAAWAVTWHLPDGPPIKHVRTVLGPDSSGYLGAQVLVDHRHNGGQGVMYIGDLTSGQTVFDPSMGCTHDAMIQLATEDEWNGRWADVLKQDVNPPTIEHSTYAEATLSNGKVVRRQAFVTLKGVDPMDFFGLEAKIAAVLDAAPFTAVCGWGSRGRPGERHPQAFTVYWSSDIVPANPDSLAPVGDREELAARWVLSGRLNEAFKAARLAAPEIHKAVCLTDKRSRGHIWQMGVRLYGGVTLADVRGAAQRLRQALGSQWLRVEAAPDGCVIVAGALPAKVRLANPGRDTRYLAGLDWEQSFLDAKVAGVGGLTPTLSAVDRLPRNEQVQVLDFTLPSGLSFVEVKGKSKALETSSKNAFVDVRRHPSGKADEFRILASEVNPMPERAGFDFAEADTGDHKIPFATNLFGEPTCYDNKLDPMLLVVGAAGGGKSVALQDLIYGAVTRGWDLWIADPAKGGVDFQFSEAYTRAFARTIWETKGMIEAIYVEVMRRKAINQAYNCGNYRDLPEDVRYNHTLIVLDEFTSMMMPEPVPKVMDDSVETLQAVEAVKAINAARAYVGTYVGKIVREARSTGFTMLLATQALKADTLAKIPGANDLKDNMSRMIMGRASFGQLQAALKMPTEAPEQPEFLPPGRGMYEGNGRAAEVIQVWFEGSQNVFAAHLAEHAQPVAAERKVDLSGFVEPTLEIDGARLYDGPTNPAPAPFPGVPQADQVVELDSIELSLDDLDLSLDDLEAEAEADDLAHGQASDAVEDDVAVEPTIVWDEIDPSAWEPEASEHGWTEIDALLAFLDQFPHVTDVTWTDSDLHAVREDGSTHADTVALLLAMREVNLHTTTTGTEEPDPHAPAAFDWDAAEAAAETPATDEGDDLAWGDVAEATDTQPTTSPDAVPVAFDWDTPRPVADAIAPEMVDSPFGNDIPVDPAWADMELQPFTPPGSTPPAAAADVEVVTVDAHTVWDEVDPSAWEPETSAYGWTEIDALMGFLYEFNQVSDVTWTDPHLFDEDDLGIPYVEVVTDLLMLRGVTLHTTSEPEAAPPAEPQPVVGQTPAEPTPAANHDDFDFEPTAQPALAPQAPAAPAVADDRLDDFDF